MNDENSKQQSGGAHDPAELLAVVGSSFPAASELELVADGEPAEVVAHEVAHHVQNVLGISDEVRALQQQNPSQANDYSVRLELQADCFAGVYANLALRALHWGFPSLWGAT